MVKNGLRQKREEGQKSVADSTHNKGGQGYAGKNGGQGILHAHIQQCRDKRSGPCSRTGKRDSYEQHQPERGVFQHLIGFAVRFILQPFSNSMKMLRRMHPCENFADKEEDKGDGNHVAQNADKKIGYPRHTEGRADGNRTAQLDQGNHGAEENVEIFFENFQHNRGCGSFLRRTPALSTNFERRNYL